MGLNRVTPRQVHEHIGTEMHAVAPLFLPLNAEARINAMRADGGVRIIVDGLRRVSAQGPANDFDFAL